MGRFETGIEECAWDYPHLQPSGHFDFGRNGQLPKSQQQKTQPADKFTKRYWLTFW